MRRGVSASSPFTYSLPDKDEQRIDLRTGPLPMLHLVAGFEVPFKCA